MGADCTCVCLLNLSSVLFVVGDGFDYSVICGFELLVGFVCWLFSLRWGCFGCDFLLWFDCSAFWLD